MTILNKMQSSYNSKDIGDNPMLNMFVENYMDLLVNAPIVLSRKISHIHEINVHRFRLIDNLKMLKETYSECSSNEERIKNVNKMMDALLQVQQFTELTNEITQSLYDEVDLKTRVLDSQWRIFSNQTLNPTSFPNQNSYSSNNNNTPSSNHNGNFKEPSEKKQKEKDKDREKHDLKHDTSTKDDKDDKDSSTTTSKPKDSSKADKNEKQNNSKRVRRGSKKDFQQDSKDGSSEDRSSTPVTTNERTNGKRATKRSRTSKTDIKVRRESTNFDSESETFNQPESDEPTYCICEQISFGEMVCCDNPNCKIEWFHFVCVSLTIKPKGRWFCPNCRGDRSNVQKK